MLTVFCYRLVLCFVISFASHPRVQNTSNRNALHVATFAGGLASSLSFSLASANSHGIGVEVLGHGIKATWGKAAFNARLDVYRSYIFDLPAEAAHDIVLFIDGFDVLFFNNKEQIVRTFLALESRFNCSLFMGAEAYCDNQFCGRMDKLAESFGFSTPWKYNNGGLLAARVWALRDLWKDPVNLFECSACSTDQEWFTLYMLEHPNLMMVDYTCTLFQNVIAVDGALSGDWAVKDGQPQGSLVLSAGDGLPVVLNVVMNTKPMVAHFPGRGHYTRRVPCQQDRSRKCSTTPLLEVFANCFPKQFEGTELQRMKMLEDALELPDFLRHLDSYGIGPDTVANVVEKIKDRDFTISVLMWSNWISGLLAISLVICGVRRRFVADRKGLPLGPQTPMPISNLCALKPCVMVLAVIALCSQFAMYLFFPPASFSPEQPPVPKALVPKVASLPRGQGGTGAKSESLLQVAVLDCSSLHLENDSEISRSLGTVELIGSNRLNLEEKPFLGKVGGHVLLTGGAGYIGSHMALLLLEQGYSVTIVDNLSRGRLYAVNVLKVEACRRKSKFAFAFVDLGSRPHLEALLLASQPDFVIHFAALAFVAESMANPLLYFRNVTENTLTLLTAMDRAGVKKLVYSSSCSTYGEHTADEMPITENTPQHPKSIYAQSKMMAEQMIAAWVNQNPTGCASILRYFNVIGADPEGRLGEIPRVRGDDKDSRISNALFDAASNRISHFKVYGNDFPTRDGTCERDYVHVSDLVSAHFLVLKQQMPSAAAEKCGHRVYNIGNGVPNSVMQLLRVVQQFPGAVPFHTDFFPRRAGDVPLVYADPSKIKSLGWSPRFTNLTEALLTAWRFRMRHAQFFPGSHFQSIESLER